MTFVRYRVVYTNRRHIEVYPTDGSIIMSRGLDSSYYDHYIPTDDGVSLLYRIIVDSWQRTVLSTIVDSWRQSVDYC